MAIGSPAWNGVKLSDITSLSYSGYTASAPGPQAVALQLAVDFDGSGTYQGRLVFEPYQNVFASPAGWQTFDARNGVWWATRLPYRDLFPQASPKTLAQVLELYPNARIGSGVIFKAGSGWNYFDGYVDAFKIGVAGVEQTFDFEYGCTYFSNPFESSPLLADFQQPDAWYPDRYRPATFASDGVGHLQIGISASDGLEARPIGYGYTFYNTQGRKFDLGNGKYTSIKGKLYVGTDWANNLRRSDMWATTEDVNGEIAAYPIIGIANVDRSHLVLRVFTQDNGWEDVTSSLAGGSVETDRWYSFEIRLMPGHFLYFVNGQQVYDDTGTYNSLWFRDMMLQGYNFNDPSLVPHASGESYDILWDDVAAVGPTIGFDNTTPTLGTPVVATLQDPGGNAITGEVLTVSGPDNFAASVNSGDGILLPAEGAYTFEWEPGCASGTVTVIAPPAPTFTGQVTGGGTLAGPASFGISAKYKKGATIPTGSSFFSMPSHNIDFASTSYAWLNVTGNRATLVGTGTLNGLPNYGFQICAVDDGPDTFQIKIWNASTGALVYEGNAQPLLTGQIKVH